MEAMLAKFEANIAAAKHTHEEWVEAPKDIIDYYNRNGLGGARYFIYKGVKVCESGQLDSVTDDLSTQTLHRTFGKSEGTVIS